MTEPTIIYTHTDEAPALATYSLLPVVQAYAARAGVDVVTRDISLAGRILATFPEYLAEGQRTADDLGELGRDVLTPEANIIKLPNVSASVPQLKAAVAELQAKGYAVPDYPEDPATDDERATLVRYRTVLGSAVNPVLRQGNSDRRAPASVKNYARSHPHRMGAWSPDSRTNVAHMDGGDFRSTEQSAVMASDGSLRVDLVAADGATTPLRAPIPVLEGEVVDAAVLRVADLHAFLDRQIARAKADGVLFSVHLKATMMKVSDPVIFGHVVRAFFPATFAAYGDVLDAAGLSPNDGWGSILDGLDGLPGGDAVRSSFEAELAAGPALAMVDSERGITNLHVPSDVIVDASMPAMIRTSGHMWGPDGEEADTLAVIPDASYAGVYQVVIDDCRAHGAFDPATMGSVPNVGLMAQAAEEYGSHDKTFEIPVDGTVRVTDDAGRAVFEVPVAAGDIFRMCQTKDIPIRDWVKLAVTRARATGDPAVFWLDEGRAHDANVIAKVRDLPGRPRHQRAAHRGAGARGGHRPLARAHPPGGEHHLGDGQRAARLPDRSLPHPRARDERQDALRRPPDQRRRPVRDGCGRLGPQARPAAAGRELPAVGQPGRVPGPRRQLRARGPAHGQRPGPGPGRHPGPGDRAPVGRGPVAEPRSWAGSTTAAATSTSPSTGPRELAAQGDDPGLAADFAGLAARLGEQEEAVVGELLAVQGAPADIGGYYLPDESLAVAVMRPSTTFNAAIDSFG